MRRPARPGEDDAVPPGPCRRGPGAAVRRLPDPSVLPGGVGLEITPASPLLVNLDRPPLLAAIGEGTVRDKVAALKEKGIGPPGWTPHWFRHSHASALLLAGTPEWVVSRRLGHAHVQTTIGQYGWVREDDDLRAAANWKSYTSSWQVPVAR
jgi:integrase